ncbi:MAG: DUF885 domain-containing protein [Saprospiraceae bacterium]|nr:DUF885 domain-containing protein [Saprospiraceae bacterium]
MRICYLLLLTSLLFVQCKPSSPKTAATPDKSMKEFIDQFYRDRLAFYPLEATTQGVEGYNDQLPITVSDAYRRQLRDFYTRTQTALAQFKPDQLDASDRISYDILKWECEISIADLDFPDNYMSINQFWGMPLTLGQFGSGSGPQPFKTVADYDNWLKRMEKFTVWMDSALVYTRKGMDAGYVLPTSLIVKVIPQFKELVVSDPTKSLYYGPIVQMPASFPAADKTRLTEAYQKMISERLVPGFRKMADFFEKEYLPKGRATSGISALPGGRERYNHLIRYWTTTNMTADEIFDLGQREVARIRSEMEKVKTQVGFKGDLKAFFDFVRTDKQFTPFKKPEEVTGWYASMETRMKPQLSKMFDLVPKSKFEVRRTEAFREASASAEYSQGTPDGSRPGIFYVPVPDAAKYNVVGGEALFLHEAIPGHHYQVSLQQEDTTLPAFRRFLWYGAYGEGWALYTESLGKELGLYTDPYQYFGMLSSEMHRAIRLVVDVGLHTKGWTREQAIQFSKDNEADSEESIVAEIERYMAIPGQALSYKIGQLKILELRAKAEKDLGDKFDLRAFHNEVLNAGCVPLNVLEEKIERWIEGRKTR